MLEGDASEDASVEETWLDTELPIDWELEAVVVCVKFPLVGMGYCVVLEVALLVGVLDLVRLEE